MAASMCGVCFDSAVRYSHDGICSLTSQHLGSKNTTPLLARWLRVLPCSSLETYKGVQPPTKHKTVLKSRERRIKEQQDARSGVRKKQWSAEDRQRILKQDTDTSKLNKNGPSINVQVEGAIENMSMIRGTCATGRKFSVDLEPRQEVTSADSEFTPSDSEDEDKYAAVTRNSDGEDTEPECDMEVGSPSGNRIVDVRMLQGLLDSVAVCKHCCVGRLTLLEDPSRRRGWASRLALKCTNSDCVVSEEWTWTSKATDSGAREVNKLSVLAMRSIGKGRRGAATFASHMNLPAPVWKNTWRAHTIKWGDAADDGVRKDFHRAVLNVKRHRIKEGLVEGMDPKMATEMRDEELEGLLVDVPVSLDGSWIRRGADSKHGFVTAISADTGEVLDRHYMSRTCRACQQHGHLDKNSMEYLDWFLEHGPDCLMNHSGSAASMEADGASELFSRSVDKYNIRYNPYIGDGDSAAYRRVCKDKPYGDDFVVKKEECVGHIQKRMGTGLRRLLDRNKGKKLADGKALGGPGRLTLARVNALQTFYGIGLRTYAGDPEAMSKATMAMLSHYAEPPNHDDCPPGEKSWCKYQVDKAMGTHTYRPPAQPLQPAVIEIIVPLFRNLADKELLSHCTQAVTQNANEALHNVVWTLVPKTSYHSPEQVQLGIDVGIMWYNRGRLATALFLLGKEGIKLKGEAVKSLKWFDHMRLDLCAYKSTQSAKERRKEQRQNRSAQLDAFKKSEGPMYKSGKFHSNASSSVCKRAPPKCRSCGQPMKGHLKSLCQQSK